MRGCRGKGEQFCPVRLSWALPYVRPSVHLVNHAVCDFFCPFLELSCYSEVMSLNSQLWWWELARWDREGGGHSPSTPV